MVLLLVLRAGVAAACDICALHSSTVLDPPRRGFSIHVTEQYTSFNSYRGTDGRDLPLDEWLQSSTTTLVVGYGFRAPFRVEASLPYVNREFYRLKDDAADRDDVSGIGDLAVVGRYTPVDRVLTDRSLVRLELFAGLELPTGSSDELADNGEEEEEGAHEDLSGESGGRPQPPRHGGGDSSTGIHDEDLALGSGSVDLLLGMNAFATYRRMFATGGFQYSVRGHGDHGYRYANDLVFHLGAGGFPLLHAPFDLAVEARLTGETKGNDERRGETVTGSGVTALYLGPNLHVAGGERFRAAVGAQFPVLQNVSDLQLVADYRILASLGWQF